MDSTCWTLVHGAAEGKKEDRESFACRYTPVIRSYFGARWRQAALLAQLEDAVQEVFYECFRSGGVLEKAEEGHRGGFRAFLYGLARNVARRHERRFLRSKEHPLEGEMRMEDFPVDEIELSRSFDRAWAQTVMREAGALQLRQAKARGAAAERRVELLHLRFYESLPIREIARRWGEDARTVHKAYERARKEFRAALEEVSRFYSPNDLGAAEKECDRLLQAIAQE